VQDVPQVMISNVCPVVGVKPPAVMIERLPPSVAVPVTSSWPNWTPGVVPAMTTSSVAPAACV
jgi:hypothetical protein